MVPFLSVVWHLQGDRWDVPPAHSCFYPHTLAFSSDVSALLHTPLPKFPSASVYLHWLVRFSDPQTGMLDKGDFLICGFICLISLKKHCNYIALK